MDKIANTSELKAELQRLASQCTPGASREAIATKLRELADRLAAAKLPQSQAHLLAYVGTKNADNDRPRIPPMMADETDALLKKGLITYSGRFAELTTKGEDEYKRMGSPKVKFL